MSETAHVALSLGANLGDRAAQLAGALRELAAGPLAGLRVSGLYESAPVEVAEAQPDYLNLCAVGDCALAPADLLARCQAIERAAGRVDKGSRRPRALDIDLLFHGQTRCATATLKLPHPGLPRRRFVLAPLAELAPDWRHPADGRSVAAMLADLGADQALRRLAVQEGWWRLEQHC